MTNNLHHLLHDETESEGYFKSIFDNALYGIATTIGTDFKFVRVNDAFCRLLEYDRDELVGIRSVGDITLPGDYPQNEKLLTNLINNEIQRFQIEKKYVTKSGRPIDVIVYVLGFYNNDGKYIGSTGSATPGSVAGVHRRTRRRTRRRWAVGTRMYTLPVGYTTAVVAGTTYYVAEGEYFKPVYEGSEVVYVAVEDPKETAAGEAKAQEQPAQAPSASTETTEQQLLELKGLYDKGLIDKEEYEGKKKEILDSM